jgi:hypothetical protein
MKMRKEDKKKSSFGNNYFFAFIHSIQAKGQDLCACMELGES